MSISKLHTLYAVSLNTATLAASPVLLDQVQSFGISTGLQRIVQRGDGAVDPTYVAIMSQRPVLAFSTTAIATALAACGINGAVIDADGSYPGIVCWFQKMAEGGTRASGSSHLKMTGAEGLLVPRSLGAGQDSVAAIRYEAVLTFDGTLDPVVVAASQALSGTPSVGELFTVGPVNINGTALEGIQSIEVEFGIGLKVASGDGNVWPTYCAIMSRDPSIRIRTTDADAIATFGASGTAQGATDSVVFFRKLAEGGRRVADGGGEHVSVSVAEGIVTVENEEVSQDGIVSADIVITPTFDGTAPILVISTTANIT
jgi:hypothetical protein